MQSNIYEQAALQEDWTALFFLFVILIGVIWLIFRNEQYKSNMTKSREVDQLRNLNKQSFDEDDELFQVRELTAAELKQIRDEELMRIMAETQLYAAAKHLADYNEDLKAACKLYEKHCLN